MYELETLFVGTGRCGTATVASIFDCTHEKIFGVHGIDYTVSSLREASWLAVPWLPCLSCEKILVVREPVACITSLASQPGLFEGKLSAYGKFIRYWLGPVTPSQFWYLWHRRMLTEVEKIIQIEQYDLVLNSRKRLSNVEVVVDKGLAKELGYEIFS